MRASAEIFKYGKVIAGKVNYILRVPVAEGTYTEGQLIQTTNGATFTLASAVSFANTYFVVAGDMTLDAAGEIVVYAGGYFNANIVTKQQTTGESPNQVTTNVALSDADIEILKTKNIFIENVATQDYAYDSITTTDDDSGD